MKKFFFAFAVLFSVTSLKAQVAISPMVVYISPATRYGEYQMINNNNYDTDIEISLKFAYPTTDSLGSVKFKWEDSTKSPWNLTPYVKIFPKRTVLKPNESQRVKFLMRLPPDAPEGMYWSRIITKSAPKLKPIDTMTDGKTARGSMMIVTYFTNLIVYQKGKIETNVSVDRTDYYQDSAYINLLFKLHQWGDVPAWCGIEVKLFDSNGDEAGEINEVTAVYSDAVKKVRFVASKLKPGKYTAKYKVTSDRLDIPKEFHTLFTPIDGKMDLIVKEAQ